MLTWAMALPPYQHLQGQIHRSEWANKLTKMQDYITLYSNAFEYENLPDEFLEVTGKNRMWLAMKFFAPCVCFFRDTANGLQCLPVTGMDKWNVAGMPEEWTAHGANGASFKRNSTNSVLMFNDYSFGIPFFRVLYDLDLMMECDNTHRQNLKAQRQPLIVEMEEDEKKSADAFIASLENDVVKVRKRIGAGGKRPTDRPYDTKAFESGRAFQGDQLASDYRYFENRILTRLGYNNENVEKKERLLVDEVNSNNEVVESFLTTRLKCEQEAFDKINKMWGYNIKVKPRKLQTFAKENTENDNSNLRTDAPVQQGKTVEELDK